MESQNDLLSAALAMRTWIHTQRASWSTAPVGGSASALQMTNPPLVDLEPTSVPTWTTAAAPIVFAPMPEPPPPTEVPSAPELLPEAAEVPRDVGVPRTPSFPRRQVLARLATVGRVTLKAAAALLLVAALGGGAFVGKTKWDAYANTPRIGTGIFDSQPPGAQVLIDGEPVGTTPLRLELAAGAHSVELQFKGDKKTQSIDIAKGKETALNIDWNAPRVGTLVASSTPDGAKVIVDGRERGVTPLTLNDLTVGTHSLVLESPEGSVRRRVTIAEGRSESITESIFPGWLHISAPMEVVVSEAGRALRLDTSGRVLLKPGAHEIRITNAALGLDHREHVEIEPGGTANVALETPTSVLTVQGPAGATVFVDGVEAGPAPLIDYRVKVGTRDVTIVDPSGASRHQTVTVRTTPLTVDFSRP